MFAPRRANPSAISRPMRFAAPVTNAVLPFSFITRSLPKPHGHAQGKEIEEPAGAHFNWRMKDKLLCLLAHSILSTKNELTLFLKRTEPFPTEGGCAG